MSATTTTPAAPATKAEFKRHRLPRRADLFQDPQFLNFSSLPDETFVDVRIVAAIFGCSVATIWRHITAGRIPRPVKVLGGRSSRWHVGSLRKQLAQIAAGEAQ